MFDSFDAHKYVKSLRMRYFCILNKNSSSDEDNLLNPNEKAHLCCCIKLLAPLIFA